MKKGTPIFVVEALRYGDRESHSYVVGVFKQLSSARKCANSQRDYRGGKYACIVNECKFDKYADEWDYYCEEVYRAESQMG